MHYCLVQDDVRLFAPIPRRKKSDYRALKMRTVLSVSALACRRHSGAGRELRLIESNLQPDGIKVPAYGIIVN